MSQSSAAPAPPRASAPSVRPAPPTPAPAGRPDTPATAPRSRARAWLHDRFEGTPGRMRLLAALAALASVVFGVVGAWTLWSAGQALDRAGAATEQVVRVQAIYADLLRADADATNAFLVGGLEDPAQRADYDAAMARVASTIALAAQSQPADGEALAALNVVAADYVSLVQQARAYNRQGLPVGQAYITNASDTLRTKARPILDALLQADTDRARAEFAAASSAVVLVVVGVLATAVLVLVGVWLARRTHRYVNVGLASATAAVLAGLIAGVSVLASIGSDVRRVSGSAFEGTRVLTVARTAAFDARANESLGLIARGQAGAKREPDWKAADVTVNAHLDGLATLSWRGGSGSAAALKTTWAAYEKAHAEVRAADDVGDWDGAVVLATDAAKGPRTSFAAFEKASASALDGFLSALSADVRAPITGARGTALALLGLGLVGSGLATRGMSRRLEEYR